MKIVFIGAGSCSFTSRLMADVLSFDSLKNSDLAFMDINEDLLRDMELLAELPAEIFNLL